MTFHAKEHRSIIGVDPSPARRALGRTSPAQGRIDAVFESAARSLRGSDARIIQEYPLGTPNACVADLEPVLRALRSVAAPGARLHVSIPNARHFSLLVDLLFRGTFGYRVFGHRDATHLRWYTRRDIVALVGRTGWDVQWAIADTFRGRNRYVDRLTLRRAREFLALQWHVLARAV